MQPISFDPALPINQKRDKIARAVAAHPVVIVCGETGSGKTTQVPKILLEMGRAEHGLIGHTQPRRIAARSVAARIAEELQTELGQLVGYKVRFHDKVGPHTRVKLMTDGILLAETQGDPMLRAYSTLVIDEAHERSLNIDFLLGFLKGLAKKRQDLKLVITSATIDAEKFSRHFDSAPVIEVSGRLYPVEVRYRPVGGDAEDTTRDEEEAALAGAVEEALRTGPGDILVFLPGEREIREAADVIRKAVSGVEILPLYARLSHADQDRVFRPGGERRVVLATNVAETSLTVPRIRYVIDTGQARVKRYSYRNKVEMLQVENVSQAAAQQRAGRCGRVADGICFRLYSEEDFAGRPRFTDPELLRSSLAAVILRALSLGLGKVEEFPFLDPPIPKAISDGYALLAELGAVDEENALTGTGRELARLPLDPRVGRMLIGGRDEGCLEQVLVVAAALSVRDPRDRPLDKAGAADERHKRFADERSDFLAFLKLWKFQSEGASRRVCRENFLSYMRLREWRDVHAQLRQSAEELGWKMSSANVEKPDGYRALHRALLAGLLGNIGLRDETENNYTGARGIKFWVHPGSGTKKPGKWIVGAELVETTRLFARTVATIEPKWLEELGGHLLKRHRERPHWEKTRAQVVAVERGTLYGLPVYADRRVHYGPLDPKLAREIFLRWALVEGDYETRAPFFAHNRRLVREIERLEHKSRRPDILVDDALIAAFYEARVPEAVTNGADFDKWRKEAERAQPKLLFLKREDLMRHEAAGITTDNFPHALQVGPNAFALEYHFEPGSPKDGVTLTAPVALLNQVPAARCEWLVPGLLKEKVRALAKGMPQRLRHKLGALDEFADTFVAAMPPSDAPLAAALARYIRAELNLEVPADAFRPDSAPPHLHMNFRVLDQTGRQLGMGRNLAELKRELGSHSEKIFEKEDQERYTGWTFGDLEEMMEIRRGGQTLVGYPALVDAEDAVTLQVFDSPEKARAIHRQGVRRLLMIAFRERVRDLEKALSKDMTLAAQKADIVAAALDRTFLAESLPLSQADFARRVQEGRSRLNLIAQEMQRLATALATERSQLEKRLAAVEKAYPAAAQDIRQQLDRLLPAGFLARHPWERLQHLPRYLKAASLRLEKLRTDPRRDAERAAQIAPLEQAWRRELAARARLGGRSFDSSAELEQFGWLLEELRVSLFAQELKTPVPVSAKRLGKLWHSIRK